MNGGKADNLTRLRQLGFPVPAWIVLGPESKPEDLPMLLREAGLDSVARFAVRSSASAEDGGACSFAGQFATRLAVPQESLADAVREVRASCTSDVVRAYCREHGVDPADLRMNVIVQEMVESETAGVAFAVDFKTGSRRAVTVSAVRGLGEGLVSELAEADTFVVHGETIDATVTEKEYAVRYAADGGTIRMTLNDAERTDPVLTENQVKEIATVVQAISKAFGSPQDVEWAYTGKGDLRILQTRPITTLGSLPDPDEEAILWDNSNIVESYPGITLPLTFSFARGVYSAVYRQFCRALGVEPSLIAANPDAFEMLGHWHGRFYYNLRNWYRVLMMLPGYRINAPFMETMMGVKEPLKDKPTIRPSRRPEFLRVLATLGGILGYAFTLPRRVRKFRARFDAVIAPLEADDFSACSTAELARIYDGLEREFIVGWRTPLVNDFFAMIAYGLLKKKLVQWGVDSAGTMQNDILVGVGNIISAEPMRRLAELAEIVRGDSALRARLEGSSDAEFLAALDGNPAFAAAWRTYLKKFGSRCMGELKLETVTYDMDPTPLLGMLRGYLSVPPPQPSKPPSPDLSALKGHPLRRFLFNRLRAAARRYVSNRENLRFERTRLFAVVRRLMLAFGDRLVASGFLDARRDVFYLTFPEVLGYAGGCADAQGFREVVAARRAQFDAYAEMPPLPERFETRGGVPVSVGAAQSAGEEAPAGCLSGIGCCRGTVRGWVRVIRDLSKAADVTGCILVAERTDPGWGPLFPLAKGVLVERGSVLSHAAILTRELGIPCVVGVKGLLAAVKDGEEVELDGAAGTVRVIGKEQV
ncbi:MAG: phosphoenolpyruvate synthase [Kiritimatiellae bacterium]|nr:phosphoenolpyruvate synthase [Kiritimatiellia bacterium]